MMTIKEFAQLCKCSTQTLRYYDKVDLLKPSSVDKWSGYRYYEKSQAIDFVKIKNLQAADFTIEEIKKLLLMPDEQVYSAFELKIEAQEHKLEQIKQIQRSYLAEKDSMEKLIRSLSDFLTSQLTDYEIMREFGLSPEEGPAAATRIRNYIELQTARKLPAEPELTMVLNDKVIQGAENIADVISALDESNLSDTLLLGGEEVLEEEELSAENFEIIWEYDGWNYVHEFIDRIPHMSAGREYCFFFRLNEDKYSESLAFPLFMISIMLPKTEQGDCILGCKIEKSEDGLNHFALSYRR